MQTRQNLSNAVDRRAISKSRLNPDGKHDKVVLSQAELDSAFFDNSDGRFPPILNIKQAAKLLQISVNTIYNGRRKDI